MPCLLSWEEPVVGKPVQDHLIPRHCHLASSPVQSNTAVRFVWAGDRKGSHIHAGLHTAWIHQNALEEMNWNNQPQPSARWRGWQQQSSGKQHCTVQGELHHYGGCFYAQSCCGEHFPISQQCWGKGCMSWTDLVTRVKRVLRWETQDGLVVLCHVPFGLSRDLAQTWGDSGMHRLQVLI